MYLYLHPLSIVIDGPMFSGKTEEAIKLARHYEIAGLTVQAFKYAEDTRYSEAEIAGHAGARLAAIPVRSSYQIEELRDRTAEVIIIDELQFLDDRIIDLVDAWADEQIIISTILNTCFTGDPFPLIDHTDPYLKRASERHVGELLARADMTIHLTAICTYQGEEGRCKMPATRTQRLIDGEPASRNAPLKVIGGKQEGYKAYCRKHHSVPD